MIFMITDHDYKDYDISTSQKPLFNDPHRLRAFTMKKQNEMFYNSFTSSALQTYLKKMIQLI